MNSSTIHAKKLGAYIHIPFCQSKCKYCNFFSYRASELDIEDYVCKLCKEIDGFDTDRIVDTVYIGGGTPTLIGVRNLNKIIAKFPYATEITVETNPNVDIDFSELNANRLSIGLQSANDNELKIIGRTHTYDQFLNCCEKASKSYDNINVDLMYGLPLQSLESWRRTYKEVEKLSPKHISFYSLTLEEPIFNDLPDDDTNIKMYWDFVDSFADYHHYEISNIAKVGYECKHNLKYWNMEEYIGFGITAHSYYKDKRFYNDKKWVRVYEKCNLELEYIFTGLRQIDGIDKKDIDKEIINKHICLGTMEEIGDKIRLTRRGIEVSNQVFLDFA